MKQARAVVVDPNAAGRLAIRPMPVRTPLPFETLVRVKSISLNLGEVRRALTMAEEGWRPGWDLAGVVEQPAADHSGPPAGARVVGFVPGGAWAEAAVVPTNAWQNCRTVSRSRRPQRCRSQDSRHSMLWSRMVLCWAGACWLLERLAESVIWR